MQTSQAGKDFIKQREGLRLTRYFDSGGQATIGYGHRILPEDYIGNSISKEVADMLFDKDIRRTEDGVNYLVTPQLTQGQFDALVSFAFNLGLDIDADKIPEGLGDSTLLKKVNANPFDDSIRDEFMKWVNVNGQQVSGLVSRREQEADLYFGEDDLKKKSLLQSSQSS